MPHIDIQAAEWSSNGTEPRAIGTRRRKLPFELAVLLFDGPVIEHSDDRRAYGEVRIRAIGAIAGSILHCVYATRGGVRRVISLRYANREECDAYRAAYPG